MLYTVWIGKPGVPGNSVAAARTLTEARRLRDEYFKGSPEEGKPCVATLREEAGVDASGKYVDSYYEILPEDAKDTES